MLEVECKHGAGFVQSMMFTLLLPYTERGNVVSSWLWALHSRDLEVLSGLACHECQISFRNWQVSVTLPLNHTHSKVHTVVVLI